jgi:protein O-GlcNAc transferase
LGVILYDLGKLDQAIVSFEMTIRLDPSHAQAYNNLGTCLSLKGQQKEAIKHLQNAIYLDPEGLMPYESLEIIYRSQGDTAKASAVAAKAAALRETER